MAYQPKTGQPCHCKRGQQRDNCPDCEGTGQRIDFAAIRASVTPRTGGKARKGRINYKMLAEIFEGERNTARAILAKHAGGAK